MVIIIADGLAHLSKNLGGFLEVGIILNTVEVEKNRGAGSILLSDDLGTESGVTVDESLADLFDTLFLGVGDVGSLKVEDWDRSSLGFRRYRICSALVSSRRLGLGRFVRARQEEEDRDGDSDDGDEDKDHELFEGYVHTKLSMIYLYVIQIRNK